MTIFLLRLLLNFGSIEKIYQCFIGYPNISNFVKDSPLCVAFSTLFSVFGYPEETLSLQFDIQPQHKSWCTKLSDGNDVDLQENERVRKKSFQYERLCTKTRFKTDEKVT